MCSSLTHHAACCCCVHAAGHVCGALHQMLGAILAAAVSQHRPARQVSSPYSAIRLQFVSQCIALIPCVSWQELQWQYDLANKGLAVQATLGSDASEIIRASIASGLCAAGRQEARA